MEQSTRFYGGNGRLAIFDFLVMVRSDERILNLVPGEAKVECNSLLGWICKVTWRRCPEVEYIMIVKLLSYENRILC